MEVLACRVLIRPTDLQRSLAFYRDVLGLAIFREFGSGDEHGVVFFAGGGLIEVSGRAPATQRAGPHVALWLQVRDASAELARLAAAGAPVLRDARREPWGLVEGWIEDPDGVRICVVEVPEDHPLRRRV